MPDAPSFPGERLIDLTALGIVRTSGGCTHPERASDGNDATAALFRRPIAEASWSDPEPVGEIGDGEAHSVHFEVIPGDPGPRFLRFDWGDLLGDRLLTRVRLKMSGAEQVNAGVAFESSLGLIEQNGDPPPPEVPLPYIPLWSDQSAHAVDLDPPLLSRGVVFYPDALLDDDELAALEPDGYPSLDLYALEVYELDIPVDSEGVFDMALPTEKRARVGVQQVKIYPHNGAAGPYDATTANVLEGLQELGIAIAVAVAKVTGGETTHELGAHETGRSQKFKVSAAVCDLRALSVLLGGTLVVDPAAGGLGEVQYFTMELGDRAPYFRLTAKSTNGDGADSFVLPKCKVEGTVAYNLEKDKVTNLEFEFSIFWDRTYVRQDGNTGGIYEQLYGAKGETAMHS